LQAGELSNYKAQELYILKMKIKECENKDDLITSEKRTFSLGYSIRIMSIEMKNWDWRLFAPAKRHCGKYDQD
jgi:hypothetical protein